MTSAQGFGFMNKLLLIMSAVLLASCTHTEIDNNIYIKTEYDITYHPTKLKRGAKPATQITNVSLSRENDFVVIPSSEFHVAWIREPNLSMENFTTNKSDAKDLSNSEGSNEDSDVNNSESSGASTICEREGRSCKEIRHESVCIDGQCNVEPVCVESNNFEDESNIYVCSNPNLKCAHSKMGLACGDAS